MRSIALSRILLSLAVVMVVPVAGTLFYQRSQLATADSAPRVTVARGSLAVTTTATGSLAARAARLSFATSGMLHDVLVKLGDHVSAGQALMQLDSQDLQLRVDQAQSQLSIAQIKLQQLTDRASTLDVAAAQAAYDAAVQHLELLAAGPKEADILAAQSELASAQASQRDADARLDALTGGAPEPDHANAVAAVIQAQGSLDAAHARLDQLEAGPTADAIQRDAAHLEEAKAQLRAAQARLEQATSGATNADATAAEAAASKARADLNVAQAKLEQVSAVYPIPADVAAAQSSLATAATNLQTAHQQLDTISEQLANENSTRVALESELSHLTRSAEDICNKLGNSSGDCQAANAKVDDLRPQTFQVEQQIKLLEPNGWDALAARKHVLAAQSAYDAAATTLKQVEAARQVPVDLITAQTTVDAATSDLTSANAKLDQVKAGATAAELVVDQSAVEQAQAAVDAAQATLNSTVAGPTDADLVSAQTGVTIAQANLDAAQSKLGTLGQPRPRAADAARSAQLSARAAVAAAQAKLDQLVSGPTQADLEAATSAVAQAQATLAQRSGGEARASDVSLQQEMVHAAEIDLRTAQRTLEKSTLRAPFDGVVQSISANTSEQIASGTQVLTLLDPRDIWLDATVDGADVGQVAVGQNAEISLDDHPDQTFSGHIGAVAAGGSLVQGVVSLPITVMLDKPDGALVPGLSAHATITGVQENNVLLLPTRAIRRQGKDSLVDVVSGNTVTPRTVHVGMSDGQSVEILDGLAEGDVALLSR